MIAQSGARIPPRNPTRCCKEDIDPGPRASTPQRAKAAIAMSADAVAAEVRRGLADQCRVEHEEKGRQIDHATQPHGFDTGAITIHGQSEDLDCVSLAAPSILLQRNI